VLGQHLVWPERSVGQAGCWWQDRFWSWRLVAERGMWAHGIIVAPPGFDEDLCFAQRRKDLNVQQLVSELRVQALAERLFLLAR